MSNKSPKGRRPIAESDVDEQLAGDDPAPRRSGEMRRTMRRISPLGLRVVVRIQRDTNISEGGLYLPEGSKQSMAESLVAEVIEVASALDNHTDEETNVSGIPMHAHVLIPKMAGVRVPWDEELRIVDTKEVLAIVDEISLV